MPFFIPGRTRCAICDQAIRERPDAAALPFVSPTDLPALAAHSRQFVHRRCWCGWSERASYAAAALHLRQRAQEAALRSVVIPGGLVVSLVAAIDVIRVEDLETLAARDIPRAEVALAAAWLRSAASRRHAESLQVGPDCWALQETAGGLELTVARDDTVFDRVAITEQRLAEWASALTIAMTQLGPGDLA